MDIQASQEHILSHRSRTFKLGSVRASGDTRCRVKSKRGLNCFVCLRGWSVHENREKHLCNKPGCLTTWGKSPNTNSTMSSSVTKLSGGGRRVRPSVVQCPVRISIGEKFPARMSDVGRSGRMPPGPSTTGLREPAGTALAAATIAPASGLALYNLVM